MFQYQRQITPLHKHLIFHNHSFSSSAAAIRPGTASIPNMLRAMFTLSMRTVTFPCSRSLTKRSPRPDLMEILSESSPVLFFLFLHILLLDSFQFSIFHKNIYPIGYNVNVVSSFIPVKVYYNKITYIYTLWGILYSLVIDLICGEAFPA